MSASRSPAERASGQNAEEEFLSLLWAPHFVVIHLEDLEDALLGAEGLPADATQDSQGNGSEDTDADSSDDSDGEHPSCRDPGANRSHGHGDRSQDVSSVGQGQRQERNTPSGCCQLDNMQRMRQHSWRLLADWREQGGRRHREARWEWQDQQAFFSGSVFENGPAVAGSARQESSGAPVLSHGGFLASPSAPRFVPGRLQDLEDALRCSELLFLSRPWSGELELGKMRCPFPRPEV